MRGARWEQAARNTSEAEECEYSSRKWCSTSQTKSKPTRSATSTCSRASAISRCSESGPQGRGSWCSKKIPNRIAVARILQELAERRVQTVTDDAALPSLGAGPANPEHHVTTPST